MKRLSIRKKVENALDRLAKELGDETFVSAGYIYYEEAADIFTRLVRAASKRGRGSK